MNGRLPPEIYGSVNPPRKMPRCVCSLCNFRRGVERLNNLYINNLEGRHVCSTDV